MPEVTIHAAAGRSTAQKHALMKAINDAVVAHFKVAPEHVVVQIVETAADNKARGGIPYSQL